MITPFCSGVDLNCGCPQSWAIKEGIGCSLMSQPDLVASMVTAAKARIAPNKSVSVKIRIHKDIKFVSNPLPLHRFKHSSN
jgi:tRNA-dihydrouridine synthase 4